MNGGGWHLSCERSRHDYPNDEDMSDLSEYALCDSSATPANALVSDDSVELAGEDTELYNLFALPKLSMKMP